MTNMFFFTFSEADLLQEYWVYNGSLTHPPCSENVTWIMMRYPLLLSIDQVMLALYVSENDQVQKTTLPFLLKQLVDYIASWTDNHSSKPP